ncbi:MAG: HD domain-containing protein [Nanoarchaeota archaeon]
MTTKLEQIVTVALNREGISTKRRDEIWELLTPIKLYHRPTFNDSMKVGLTSRDVANFMGFEPGAALCSGLLHDIGKVGISIELLNKSEGWNDEDYEKMKPHTQIGYDILLPRGLVIPAWVALTHHRFKKEDPYPKELPNYPATLQSSSARLVADMYSRIVSLADQYDALHRKNDMHGQKPLTQTQVKETLIKGNSDMNHLIEEFYKHRILPSKF